MKLLRVSLSRYNESYGINLIGYSSECPHVACFGSHVFAIKDKDRIEANDEESGAYSLSRFTRSEYA